MRTTMLATMLAAAPALLIPAQPLTAVQVQPAATTAVLQQRFAPAESLVFPTSSTLASGDLDDMFGIAPAAAPAVSAKAKPGKVDFSGLSKSLPAVDPKALEELSKAGQSALTEAQKALEQNEPALRKAADDALPALQTAGDATLKGLAPVLERGYNTALPALQKLAGEAGTQLGPVAVGVGEQLKSQIATLGAEVQKEAGAAGGKIEGSVPTDLKAKLDQAKPILDTVAPIATSAVKETEKALEASAPVLQKTVEELTPTLKSGVDVAVASALPVLQGVFSAAGDALASNLGPQAEALTPAAKDAGTAALLVATPFVLIRVFSIVRSLLAPALAAFVLFVGLGLSSEISSSFPDLGSPLEVRHLRSAATPFLYCPAAATPASRLPPRR